MEALDKRGNWSHSGGNMDDLRVFGIGLNKTGTTSLKLAFEKLGLRHFSRSPRAFRLYRQERWDQLFAMIAPFQSFEDWPWPLMVPQLLEHYGDNARFVLTRRRSAQDWLDSLKAHSLKTNPDNNPRFKIFGYHYPHGVEAQHLAFYETHLAETRALFADRPGQLCELCWEEGDGWSDLCGFLDMRAPWGAFPHANKGATANIPPERLADNKAAIAAQLARLKKS